MAPHLQRHESDSMSSAEQSAACDWQEFLTLRIRMPRTLAPWASIWPVVVPRHRSSAERSPHFTSQEIRVALTFGSESSKIALTNKCLRDQVVEMIAARVYKLVALAVWSGLFISATARPLLQITETGAEHWTVNDAAFLTISCKRLDRVWLAGRMFPPATSAELQ